MDREPQTWFAVRVTGQVGGSGRSAIGHIAEADPGTVSGPPLRPGDGGWDDAVRIWNRMVATEPDVPDPSG